MHYQPTFSPNGTPHHLSHYTGPLPRPTAQHYGTDSGGGGGGGGDCTATTITTITDPDGDVNEFEFNDPSRQHHNTHHGGPHQHHMHPSSSSHLSNHHNQHHSSPHSSSPHSVSVDPPRYVTMHRRQTPASRDMYISPGKFSGLHNSTSDLLHQPSGGNVGGGGGAGSNSSSNASLFSSDPFCSHPFKKSTNLERSASVHLHQCSTSTSPPNSSSSLLSSKPFVMADFYKYSDRYQPCNTSVQSTLAGVQSYHSQHPHKQQYPHHQHLQQHTHPNLHDQHNASNIQQRLHQNPANSHNRNSVSSNSSSQDGGSHTYLAAPVPSHRGIVDDLYNRFVNLDSWDNRGWQGKGGHI